MRWFLTNRLPTERLVTLLFEHVHKPDDTPYTAAEVSEASGISAPLLSALRNGTRTNPTLENVHKLLDFFGVPAIYLDAQSEEQAIRILQYRERFRLRNADSNISIQEFDLIIQLLEQIKQDEIDRLNPK